MAAVGACVVQVADGELSQQCCAAGDHVPGVCLLTFTITALGKPQPDKISLAGCGLWPWKGHAQHGLEGNSPVHDGIDATSLTLTQPGVALPLGSSQGILCFPRARCLPPLLALCWVPGGHRKVNLSAAKWKLPDTQAGLVQGSGERGCTLLAAGSGRGVGVR